MWIMTSYVDNYFIEASKVSDIFTYVYLVFLFLGFWHIAIGRLGSMMSQP